MIPAVKQGHGCPILACVAFVSLHHFGFVPGQRKSVPQWQKQCEDAEFSRFALALTGGIGMALAVYHVHKNLAYTVLAC